MVLSRFGGVLRAEHTPKSGSHLADSQRAILNLDCNYHTIAFDIFSQRNTENQYVSLIYSNTLVWYD